VWDSLINDNDQIFLTLNGHYWPPGRVTLHNAAGNDVHVHITNYQNRYFGGARDDPALPLRPRAQRDRRRDRLAVDPGPGAGEAQRAGRAGGRRSPPRWTTSRCRSTSRTASPGSRPVPSRPGRPAKQLVIPGTLAYWRFDAGHANATPVTAGQTIKDQSGHGNDLSTLVTVPGSASDALTWSLQYHPDQPGHGSLYFNGGQNPLHGAYLTTAAGAPLNTEDVRARLHHRAVRQHPADWDSGQQLVDGGTQPLGRERPGGQVRAATPTRTSRSSPSASRTAASRSGTPTRST
jgi:hypothetical protein